MYNEVLEQIGLTPEQAEIYQALLEEGPQTASKLDSLTSVSRTYVYQIAEELQEMGLITKKKDGRTTVFTALSPETLLTQAETEKMRLERATHALEGVLPDLKSKYAASAERPVVTYYEGHSGFKKVLRMVIDAKQPLILFRSVYDDKSKHVDDIIQSHLDNQVQAGITTRTITPLEESTKQTFLELDEKRLVDRRIISSFDLTLPSQVMIFGSKTAFISLKKSIVALVIDNEEITESMKKIFEYMWILSTQEHEQITKEWN